MNASKWMVIFAVVLLTALPVFASGSSLEHSPEVEFNLADPWWTRTTWLVFGVIFNWGWHFLVGRIPGKRGEVRKAVGVWLNEKRQARMTVLKSLSAPMELTIHSEDFLLQPALEEGPVSYCIVRCVAHEWAIGMARVEYTSWNQINVAFFLHGNRKIPRISFER